MNENKRIIGERMKMIREARGIKQNRVAQYLGVHNSTVAKYESGEREPDIEAIIKLSQLYGVSVDYLLGNDEGDFVYPESEIERVISETEKHYGVILRDDPVVYEAMRQLILGIAKAKKDQQS